MKRYFFILSLILTCLITTDTAFGQNTCKLDIVGTWKAAGPEGANTVLYRFGPDSTVTVLSPSGPGQSAEMREVAKATYTIDNPRAPKTIEFKADKAAGAIAQGTSSVNITAYDDMSITYAKPGQEAARLVRVDQYRYFLVLAGRKGTFYDLSGPTFPMLIKMDEGKTEINAFGIYSSKGLATFGPIPAETYNEFMKEPVKATDVMLRLEINGAQYERGLSIVRTWERRLRENTLLYPDVSMDNILLAKQITETLNQCGESVKLYNLDWGIEDTISDNTRPSLIPFLYFKELRRLNESIHVRDEKFHEHGRRMQQPAAQ